MGGGIGLIASARLLAAADGNGLLEVDANENPLKEGLAQPFPKLEDGNFIFKPQSGLGVEPDFSQVKSFLQFHKKKLA